MGWTIPPKRYVEILSSGKLEYDLIYKLNVYRGHKVKMKSFKWALMQYDCCLYKKEIQRQIETHRGKTTWIQRRECHVEVRQRLGRCINRLRRSGTTNKFSETARKTWNRFSLPPLKSNQLCWPLNLGLPESTSVRR